jgi:hypothetical protein
MNRLISVAVLVAGLLVGYFSRPPIVQAQPPGFPFGPGDLISISYDTSTSRSCVIESFFGSFVSCKVPERPFERPFDRTVRPHVYNLSTSMSVTLMTRANER